LEMPGSLNITNVTANSVALTWIDLSTNETAFVIERAPGNTTNWAEIERVSSNVTSHVDTPLLCGRVYQYRVRAYRAPDDIYSSYSNVATATMPACVPADVSLSMLVSALTPDQGVPFDYVLTVNNAGPASALDIAVTDNLPAGLHLVSAQATQGQYDVSSAIWQIGDIPSGSSATLILKVRAGGGTFGHTIVNAAEITWANIQDPDSTPGNGDTQEDDWAQRAATVGCAPAAALNVPDGDVVGLIVAIDASEKFRLLPWRKHH
jgi:uncharacterized repeat protein (TIGR01451 family)